MCPLETWFEGHPGTWWHSQAWGFMAQTQYSKSSQVSEMADSDAMHWLCLGMAGQPHSELAGGWAQHQTSICMGLMRHRRNTKRKQRHSKCSWAHKKKLGIFKLELFLNKSGHANTEAGMKTTMNSVYKGLPPVLTRNTRGHAWAQEFRLYYSPPGWREWVTSEQDTLKCLMLLQGFHWKEALAKRQLSQHARL